jgi:hypothetical protein
MLLRSKWIGDADREQVNEYKFLSGNVKERRRLMRGIGVKREQC